MHNKFILNLCWLFVLNRNFGLCALVMLFFDCTAFATEHKNIKTKGQIAEFAGKGKTQDKLNTKLEMIVDIAFVLT